MTVTGFNDLEKRTTVDIHEKNTIIKLANSSDSHSPILIRDIHHLENITEKQCFYYHRLFSQFCQRLNQKSDADPYGSGLGDLKFENQKINHHRSKVYVTTEFNFSRIPTVNNKCSIYIRPQMKSSAKIGHTFKTTG